jgi:hypothetical protein
MSGLGVPACVLFEANYPVTGRRARDLDLLTPRDRTLIGVRSRFGVFLRS